MLKAAHCAPPPLEAAEISFVWSYKDRNIFLALKTTPEEVELKQKYTIVQKRICFLAIHFLFGEVLYIHQKDLHQGRFFSEAIQFWYFPPV